MEMTTVKTVAVLAIIVGCFAIIYPRMFHPLLFGGDPTKKDDHISNSVPPHLRHPKSPAHKEMEDVTRHMKSGPHGPHPGLRAMGEMRKQAAETRGSGRGGGIMSMVLPLYAVGIVVYMVYTLVKVFTRKGAKGNDRQQKKGTAKETDATQNLSQTDLFLAGKKGQRELQQLLLKAEKDDINEDEITTLKRRLMETELQMSRILKAMEMAEKKTSGLDDFSDIGNGNVVDGKSLADELSEAQNGDVENLTHNGGINAEDLIANENGDISESAKAASDDDADKSDSENDDGDADQCVEEELEEEDLDESGGEPPCIDSSDDSEDVKSEISHLKGRLVDAGKKTAAGDLRKRKTVAVKTSSQ